MIEVTDAEMLDATKTALALVRAQQAGEPGAITALMAAQSSAQAFRVLGVFISLVAAFPEPLLTALSMAVDEFEARRAKK